MSIARAPAQNLRSFRSLIDFTRAARVFIKDLKDLDMGPARFSIDIKDLKDLRQHRDDGGRGGNPLGCACGIRGPPRYGNIKPRGLSY